MAGVPSAVGMPVFTTYMPDATSGDQDQGV